MIKKIIISLIFVISIFFTLDIVNSANCTYTAWDTSTNIDWCLQSTSLVNPWSDATIEWWFKAKILDWTTNIASFLWLMAVWAIVFWSFMMAISTWEEEKIKKAKDMIKWAIIWFLWVVMAGSLIAIVVNFMYSL